MPEETKRPIAHEDVVFRMPITCAYCNKVGTVNRKTLTCTKCGTTAPRNYGANQRKDRHGNKL